MTTFKESRAAILAALPAHGWEVQTRNASTYAPLKVPHATQDGVRLYFKAQAIYVSRLAPHSLNEAQSLADSNKEYVGREAELTAEALGWPEYATGSRTAPPVLPREEDGFGHWREAAPASRNNGE